MNTELNASVYVYTPENIADIPKEEPARSTREKIGDAIRAVKRASFEQKVMGVVGAVCAFGGMISFGGSIASAINDSAKQDFSGHQRLRDGIPRVIFTDDCTNIGMNPMNSTCTVGAHGLRVNISGNEMFRTCQSHEQPDVNKPNEYRNDYFRPYIIKNKQCKVESFAVGDSVVDMGSNEQDCLVLNIGKNGEYKANGCKGFSDDYSDLVKGVTRMCEDALLILKSERNEIAKVSSIQKMMGIYRNYKSNANDLKLHKVMNPYLTDMVEDVLGGSRHLLSSIKNELLKDAQEPTEPSPTPTQEPLHTRSRTGLYAGLGVSATLAGGILLASWARSTILKAGKTQVGFNFHELSNTIEMEINGDGFFVKTDDPEVGEKLKSMLIKAAGVSMKAGIHIGEVYDAMIEVCDKTDAILGNSEVGDSVMHVVRAWFTQNYEKEFKAHLVSLGIELPQVVKWASPKDPETSPEEMAMITAKLHTMNMV